MSKETQILVSRKVFLPHYLHLLDSDADIDFLWGGRDTGKSYFIGQKLLLDCLSLPYFKGILIKKVERTIKDSQVAVLKSIVHKWGMSSMFRFKESPLEIHCINGNKFIARGCDNPENLKSIADPTHAWYEEGNQLTKEDFIVISTTLRSNDTKVKQYFSFNPEAKGDYKKHWLWPYFSEKYKEGIYTFFGEKVIKLDGEPDYVLRYSSTHGTYHTNPFCSPQRRATLEELKYIDPYFYRVYTKGMFGSAENKRPFVLSYNPNKHRGKPELNRNEVVWLSFDFNKDPMCCLVIQHYGGEVKVLRCIKIPKSDIYEMCDYILALYSGCMFMVTGDASGRNSSALMQDNGNYYTVITKKLSLNSLMLKVPLANPRIEKNRMLINAVLAKYPVVIHDEDADGLISDFENVEAYPSGALIKADRDDPDQQADALDCWRYFCNTELKPYINYLDSETNGEN